MSDEFRTAWKVVFWLLLATALAVGVFFSPGCAHEKPASAAPYLLLLPDCMRICEAVPVAGCQASNGEIGCVCPHAPGKTE